MSPASWQQPGNLVLDGKGVKNQNHLAAALRRVLLEALGHRECTPGLLGCRDAGLPGCRAAGLPGCRDALVNDARVEGGDGGARKEAWRSTTNPCIGMPSGFARDPRPATARSLHFG